MEELQGADAYETFPFTRDRFLIGSNGGPTAYAFFVGRYVSLPFVFAGKPEDEMNTLGDSFSAFIDAIARGDGY